ncbi:MAG: ABC transporter ATP-binding protein [Candidatus Hodarchaeales archaeon]
MAYAIEMIDISKSFPGVQANDQITLQVQSGEIHGLLGENGAGKSTIMNVLFGLYQPDSGTIKVDGSEVFMDGPRTAIDLGIVMIHQHFMLVKTLTVAENIILGDEPSDSLKILKNAEISTIVADLLDQIGFQLDPTALIEDISVGLQQRVEILKALYRNAKFLILDEPTAVLTPQEADELFETIRKLKKQGVTIIFITHKLREIKAICDRVTILRQGKVAGVVNTAETTTSDLASLMVGREVLFDLEKMEQECGEAVLEAKTLSAIDDRNLLALDSVSFCVNSGEIVGIAGVQGNGQSELVEVLTGLRNPQDGEITINGASTIGFSPRAIFESGVAHIPEDRLKRGLISSFSIRENMILGLHYTPGFARFTVLDNERINEFANECVEAFEIKLANISSPVSTMSGGNQQKVILARELLGRKPKLIIAAQPTRGLDVGVIEYVHQTLLQMRERGMAVLLVSTELDEIRALADRAYVLFKGKIMAEVDPKSISDQDISLLMAGITLDD